MKLLRLITVAALLIAAVLTLIACNSAVRAEAVQAVDAYVDDGVVSSMSDYQSPIAALEDAICATRRLESFRVWRDGPLPLNVVFREARPQPSELSDHLDGYRDVSFRPKIATLSLATGFNGLGHEHFARADV